MTEKVCEAPAGASRNAGDSRIEVREVADSDTWQDYVATRGNPLFHRWEWNEPFAVYGLRVTRLVAFRGGDAVGALPLVRQKSLLFGHRLVSMPWFDSAGILADDDESRSALVAAALDETRRRGADTLELRQPSALDPDWPARTDKVLMRLDLRPDPDELWKGFSAKVRNQVRKGEKSGLTVDSGGEELVDEFHRIYSTNMRDLGSPAHSRKFFRAIATSLTEELRVYVARIEGEAIGAGLTLANGRCVEIPWASSLRGYNSLCVNHLMYWTMLERSCRDGFEWFHFGRSSVDSGTYRFKKQWGCEAVPLHWYSFSAKSGAAVESKPGQEGFEAAINAWRRLPLSVANFLGPLIVRRVA